MRSTKGQTSGQESHRDAVPGSHRARRRPSEGRLEAVNGKRREESGPPTKPSIVPPSPRPEPRPSTLGDASPLVQLEHAAPTLTYGVVVALAGAALGLGALLGAWSGGRQGTSWLASTLWIAAVSALIFSSSMAVVITVSFTRRLRVLSVTAWRLSQSRAEPVLELPKGDALTSLAVSLTTMAEHNAELRSELEQCVEEEQARVDQLVRERTRALAREADDYRRMLGESKALLTIDREGRVLGQSAVLDQWLGAMPRTGGQFWEYLERVSSGVGSRFESAWTRAVQTASAEPDLESMPTSLVVGARHFALQYKGMLGADGKLDRVLVLLSDVTVPEPDPATSV